MPPRCAARANWPWPGQSASRLILSSSSSARAASPWASHSDTLPRPPACSPSCIFSRGIRSILKPAPQVSRYDERDPSLPVISSSPAGALRRKEPHVPHRTGLLAIKKGMTAVYDAETGRRTPCTIVQVDRAQVVGHKTRRRHGYYAVQVGHGWRHPSNVTRPMLGYYAGREISPKKKLVEFRVKGEDGLVAVGEHLTAAWFVEGQFLDVKANCKGKGFAGGMKKHGWSGQPASHGNSLSHRVMGSAGQSQGGGSRVYPGKNMPGRMGGQQVTTQNVKVLKVDDENGIIMLHGCISGPKGCLVKLRDAVKKPWPDVPPNKTPPRPASASVSTLTADASSSPSATISATA